MSSKHPRPKNPEKLLTTREDVINFMNYISTDENFCLRVWNTVQGVHERALKEAQAAQQPESPEVRGECDLAPAEDIVWNIPNTPAEAVPA